jgi:ABC-2 type transport system permease protein
MTTAAVLGAFVRRDWMVARSYRLQFALQLVSMLFQLMMFFYLARIVSSSDFAEASEVSGNYFAFVVLGLALFNFLSTALTAVSSSLGHEQLTGSLEALLTTPPPGVLLIVATSSYAFIRGAIHMVLYISMAVILFGLRFDPSVLSWLAAVVALIASVLMFGALGIVVAAFTLVFKRATAFLGLLTTGIGVLGGVYFPVSVLPGPLRLLAEILPVTWALSTVRQALLDGTVDLPRLGMLVLATALLLPATIWVLGQAIRRARQDGSLAQY